jgi:hypothetical protein
VGWNGGGMINPIQNRSSDNNNSSDNHRSSNIVCENDSCVRWMMTLSTWMQALTIFCALQMKNGVSLPFNCLIWTTLIVTLMISVQLGILINVELLLLELLLWTWLIIPPQSLSGFCLMTYHGIQQWLILGGIALLSSSSFNRKSNTWHRSPNCCDCCFNRKAWPESYPGHNNRILDIILHLLETCKQPKTYQSRHHYQLQRHNK